MRLGLFFLVAYEDLELWHCTFFYYFRVSLFSVREGTRNSEAIKRLAFSSFTLRIHIRLSPRLYRAYDLEQGEKTSAGFY